MIWKKKDSVRELSNQDFRWCNNKIMRQHIYKIKEQQTSSLNCIIFFVPTKEYGQKAKEALEMFMEWLPSDSKIVAWSDNDEMQLRHELEGKKIAMPKLSGINYNC